MAYTNGYRYTRVPGDNQAAIEFKQIQNPAYNATIALANLDCEKNIIDFAQLTGATTVTADVASPFTGDEMTLLFAADASTRVVTLSTGFNVTGTITVLANKFANIKLVFSGAAQKWIEASRYVQA